MVDPAPGPERRDGAATGPTWRPAAVPGPAVPDARVAPVPDAPRHDAPAPEALVPDAPVPDADLLAALAAGDSSALAELYRRYGRPSYSLARRVCADDGVAEDVVQEVFLALWRQPGRYDPGRGSFSTWLLTVVHHKAVDAVRRESTIRRRTVPAGEAGEDWSPTPVPGADQDAMARVAAGQVRDALHRLPDEQRHALALAYYGGHTQREVAVLTGVPLGTVKSRMFAGVQRLRALLESQIGPEALAAELRSTAEGTR